MATRRRNDEEPTRGVPRMRRMNADCSVYRGDLLDALVPSAEIRALGVPPFPDSVR